MLPYPVVTPWWIQSLYPSCIWELPPGDGNVYLTFDDGPDPVITPYVLDTLREFGAKATFFCIGKNVQAHPALYERILDEGHAVGNHTHTHPDGWTTPVEDYLSDVETASVRIRSDLFRPPYGRITRSQIKRMRKRDGGTRIVMWTLLSGDFDSRLSGEGCVRNVLNHLRPGAIVTFHDSVKAAERLRHTLPVVLNAMEEKEWKAVAID